ncbi:MAG: hypothetical protein R3Y53_02810 [Bacillota bacterium]
MIYVNSALKQEEIIQLLEALDGDIKFKYLSKQGIRLSFVIDGGEKAEAAELAKQTIKSSEFGASLYFQVTL